MSDWWWYVLVAVVVVAAAVVLMRGRSSRTTRATPAVDERLARDYGNEREAGRLGGMSDEDRAWESASLERNRKSVERDQPPQTGG